MAAAVPVVEAADHRDALRVRCPDGEARAGDAVHGHDMRAHLGREIVVAAVGEEIEIELADQRREGIGILELADPAAAGGAQQIGLVGAGQHAAPQALRVDPHHGGERQGGGPRDDLHRVGFRQERAHHRAAVERVRAQQRERVAMARSQQRRDRCGMRRGAGLGGGGRRERRSRGRLVHEHASCQLASSRLAISSSPRSGMESQSGRLPAS